MAYPCLSGEGSADLGTVPTEELMSAHSRYSRRAQSACLLWCRVSSVVCAHGSPLDRRRRDSGNRIPARKQDNTNDGSSFKADWFKFVKTPECHPRDEHNPSLHTESTVSRLKRSWRCQDLCDVPWHSTLPALDEDSRVVQWPVVVSLCRRASCRRQRAWVGTSKAPNGIPDPA